VLPGVGGICFRTVLPTASPQSLCEDAVSGQHARRAGGAGRHILFVDDDDVLRITFESLLYREGYRVTTCPGFVEALATVRSHPMRFRWSV
jgi:hypothetical protein